MDPPFKSLTSLCEAGAINEIGFGDLAAVINPSLPQPLLVQTHTVATACITDTL